MTDLLQWVGRLAMVAALTAPALVRADDSDIIDYRKHIMKTMGEQEAAIGMILQQKAPADNFNTHVQILAITASTALKAFEPKVHGGGAKPEVWDKWADFAKRMNELAASTADLAKAARSGGVTAAAPKVQASLTCQSCHDIYLEPPKK